MKHLFERGCKHIVYADRISRRGHTSKPDDLRYSGFQDEMEANGLTVGPENIISGCHSQEELMEEVQKRLQSGVKIDGIFGRNDMIACVAMQAAIQAGWQVPQQIKVVGFDDSSISRYCSPRLTTIQMNQKAIAEKAVDMVTELVGGKQPENVDFDISLVERESTLDIK